MLEGDLEKLYYTTLNYMHKIRIREPELQARMVLADTFAKGMVHNVEECVRKARGDLDAIYLRSIRGLAEHDVSNACLQLVDEIGKEFAHDDKLPVLDGELSIYQGFQTIMNKLGDPDRILRQFKCRTEMMDEMEYYDAGIKVGKMYEKERILRFLNEKKKRNAKVVSILELTEFIEDGGRFKKTTNKDKRL